MGGGSIIGILYLGFVAVTFALMSIAQSTDDANDLLELDSELPPVPFRCTRGSIAPRATSSSEIIRTPRQEPVT